MPFQSEKQRRFLWAAHPEIAKRWAHEYPDSNKGLPMYAHKKDDKDTEHSKAAVLAVLKVAVHNAANMPSLVNINVLPAADVKTANSGMMHIEMPHNDHPTYAGEEQAEGEEKQTENEEENETAEKHDQNTVEALFGKLSAVLAKPLREALEQAEAEAEARDPRFVPDNLGLRRFTAPSPSIMPPMGMTAAPGQPQSQPQPVQQPANTPSNGPVGGGSNPQFNPINAFGAIGAKGQLNGNAAFGQKNSPDSSKIAAATTPCSCGCGDTVSTCKCGPSCKCRKPGGSCYKAEKHAGTPAWQRSEGKNEEGGLNEKGRKSYEREHGGDLKAPVTESNPTGERAGRQKSFCSRMCGMKRVNTGAKTKSDPDSRINKSLRKWNCKCASAFEFGQKLAEMDVLDQMDVADPVTAEAPEQENEQPKPSSTKLLAALGGNALLGQVLLGMRRQPRPGEEPPRRKWGSAHEFGQKLAEDMAAPPASPPLPVAIKMPQEKPKLRDEIVNSFFPKPPSSGMPNRKALLTGVRSTPEPVFSRKQPAPKKYSRLTESIVNKLFPKPPTPPVTTATAAR